MSKEDIKLEINKVLDDLSDKSLENILAFLKSVKSKQDFLFNDHTILEKIISEDKDLLAKLAK